MTTDVTDFIAAIPQPWQVDLATNLRERVYAAIPDATERLQYKKPHFLKNGTYAAVITPAKAHLSLTIFNAQDLQAPDGLFEPGPPERATIKFKEGQAVDLDQIESLLAQASATI
jgi:hypothetical protein